MTLVSSGTIRMSQINTELGRTSNLTITLDKAENGVYGAINTNSTSRPSATNPATMSEWYGYNHNAVAATPPTFNWTLSRVGPTGGVLTIYINESPTPILNTATAGSGTITVSAGDSVLMNITQNFKVSDTTSLQLSNQSGVIATVSNLDADSSLLWVMQNNNNYSLLAVQGNAI